MVLFRKQPMVVKGDQAREMVKEIKRKPTLSERKELDEARKHRLPTKNTHHL